MRRFRNRMLAVFLVLSISSPVLPQSTARKDSSSDATSRTHPATLSDRERVIHALNRLTFGPRPGDVDAV
jgi:hypothetical protein